MSRPVPFLLAMLSFTGCKLIDQRTFAPSPEAKAQPAPAVPAVAIDARAPLLTIDYTRILARLRRIAALCRAGGRKPGSKRAI